MNQHTFLPIKQSAYLKMALTVQSHILICSAPIRNVKPEFLLKFADFLPF